MTSITRRTLLMAASALGALGLTAGMAFAEPPPLAKKDSYKVGFAQTESNNPWRIAQTNSMQEEAKKLGHQLNGLERIKTIRGVGYIYGATSERSE